MRKKIVAGNWKMNTDYDAGVSLFSEILQLVNQEAVNNQEAIVCAPFISLKDLVQLAKDQDKVAVGAQNCHQEDSGAFTGEISANMLQAVGVSYVILGHSERRQYFGENDTLLAQKVDAALRNKLRPIFCIGETLDQRNGGEHFQVIQKQLEQGVFHLSNPQFKNILLAYEPVWAIGTGLTATPQQAQEVHAFIRAQLAKKYGAGIANDTTILYGGSCNPKNASELFAQEDIDGGLIGGASLKARDFVDIVNALN